MLGSIGSFFGRIFGTEKALEKIIDSASSGLDKLIYTDQEKAADAAKATTEARAMVVSWMQATQGQNLARRLISLSVTFVWLSQFLVAQGLHVAAIWAADPSKLASSADVLLKGSSQMNDPVMLILAFYFAAPHMGDIAKSILGRRVNGGVSET